MMGGKNPMSSGKNLYDEPGTHTHTFMSLALKCPQYTSAELRQGKRMLSVLDFYRPAS